MRALTRKQNQPRQRVSFNLTRANTAAIHQPHPILSLQRKPDDLEARSKAQEVSRFSRDFSQIPVHPESPAVLRDRSSGPLFQQLFDGKPKKEGEKTPQPKKPPSREPCDNKCGTTSGGPYGNTECEIDLKSGLLTGKVTKEIFDKNPCTRPCVEVHEGVHAKRIAPICSAAKKCLDAAGGDFKKQDKCLDKHEADINALVFSTECAAYTAEEECLGKSAKKAECKSTDGKKRWDEQMKMVQCYKGCFCKG